MLNCKDSVHRLLEFLDGDLSPEDQAELKHHFEGCPPCEEFLASYAATPKLCREHLAKTMPKEVATKLHEFLRNKLAQH
ncbi:MAG: anti-sigma factor family protein [Myxococcaceae bacterium]